MKPILAALLCALLAAGCAPGQGERLPHQLLEAPFEADFTLSTGESGHLSRTGGDLCLQLQAAHLASPLLLVWEQGALTAQLGDQSLALEAGRCPDCALPRLITSALEAAQGSQALCTRQPDGTFLLQAPSLLGEVQLGCDSQQKNLLWLKIPSQGLELTFTHYQPAP